MARAEERCGRRYWLAFRLDSSIALLGKYQNLLLRCSLLLMLLRCEMQKEDATDIGVITKIRIFLNIVIDVRVDVYKMPFLQQKSYVWYLVNGRIAEIACERKMFLLKNEEVILNIVVIVGIFSTKIVSNFNLVTLVRMMKLFNLAAHVASFFRKLHISEYNCRNYYFKLPSFRLLKILKKLKECLFFPTIKVHQQNSGCIPFVNSMRFSRQYNVQKFP